MFDFAKAHERPTWAGLLGALGLAVLLSPPAFVRAQESGDDDEPRPEAAAPDKDRAVEKDAAARLGEHLSELAGQIRKDAGPVGEEVRKALESAASTVNDTLKKERLSAEDLRDAFDRAGEQLHKAFRAGGPVDRETREAWEKARDELREALGKANDDARQALRERLPDEPGASDELTKARQEVRELQGKLREAARKLGELERREALERRGPRNRDGLLRERRDRPISPPSRPEESERITPESRRPNESMDRQERRLRELEESMKQLREDLKSFMEEHRAKDANPSL